MLSQPTQSAAQGEVKQLGFIGGGVMAEAILSRLLAQGIYLPSTVVVSDVSSDRLGYLQQTYQVATTTSNRVVANTAQAVVLAVKPQSFDAIAAELSGARLNDSLWISILAGVPLARLECALGAHPMIRVMPNTPATVGAGMTALTLGQYALPRHQAIAEQIFAAVGEVITVPEQWMDAVTGLSGSGPAFVAIAIEAMTDGGVAAGLPRAISAQLALQTVLGTAELLKQKQLHPAVLKDQVTSPGGTTIAGVASLEASGFRSALIQAVQAAYRRSQELGQ
ncbi:MAG: pyrroline-5-carboxylate reductase [Thermosynechococcaceae cyanobacterium]